MFNKDIQKLWPQSHRAVYQQNMIINSPDVKTLKLWHVCGILLIFFSISISSLVHTCICMHDVRLKGLASWHKDHPYFVHRELACLMISRGGSRGRVQGVRTPPPDDLRLST